MESIEQKEWIEKINEFEIISKAGKYDEATVIKTLLLIYKCRLVKIQAITSKRFV